MNTNINDLLTIKSDEKTLGKHILRAIWLCPEFLLLHTGLVILLMFGTSWIYVNVKYAPAIGLSFIGYFIIEGLTTHFICKRELKDVQIEPVVSFYRKGWIKGNLIAWLFALLFESWMTAPYHAVHVHEDAHVLNLYVMFFMWLFIAGFRFVTIFQNGQILSLIGLQTGYVYPISKLCDTFVQQNKRIIRHHALFPLLLMLFSVLNSGGGGMNPTGQSDLIEWFVLLLPFGITSYLDTTCKTIMVLDAVKGGLWQTAKQEEKKEAFSTNIQPVGV